MGPIGQGEPVVWGRVHILLPDDEVGDHLGLPPGHGAGAGRGKEGVQGRHVLLRLTPGLNTASLRSEP